MKLTKSIKELLLANLSQDFTPIKDDRDEHIRLINNALKDHLPASVYKLWTDPETQFYIATTYMTLRSPESGLARGYTIPYGSREFLKNSKAVEVILSDLTRIGMEKKKQDKVLSTVRDAIHGVNTVKQLEDAYPDLVKYLPVKCSSESLCTSAKLPAIELSTILKQVGWRSNDDF